MFGWFKELLEIRYEFRERKLRLREEAVDRAHVCNSCEVLKVALERANYEKDQLLKKLLEPEVVVEQAKQPITVSMPKQLPFALRRQMLEAADREKADVLKQQRIEEEKLKQQAEIDRLEKEMKITGS